MQIRARPVTLPAKGSRMATFGISRYLGEEEGEKKEGRAEKRSFETGDPLDRDASACVAYRRYRILTIRRKNVTIIFGECRSNDGCVVN